MGIISCFPGGGGVQPDWNQNDSTQPDYVKNRPFYTGNPVETVLVEEITVSFAANHGSYVARFPSTFVATVGETYKVSWDGTTYECACVDFNNNPFIGNLSFVGAGSDTGEPFIMGILNGEEIQIATADTSASHTVSISGFAPEVVKIDKKYLVQPDWNQNDSTQPDYIKNRPFYTGDPVETVLVEESTVSFTESGGRYIAQFQSTFSATVGETYKVYWDGVAYECVCVNVGEGPIIGNLSIAGGGSDTGEPFVMGILNGEGINIMTADTSASHTVSISAVVSVVKIDEKYLPNSIISDISTAQSTANTAQYTANDAQSTADAAQSTANDAQSTANTAQSTANDAQSTADAALKVLDGVFSSVATFTFDKQTSGRDTFVFNAFHYYKISDFNPAPEDVISFEGTNELGTEYSVIQTGNNCVGYGEFFIVVASAGVCSLAITEATTESFTSPSAGLYARYEEGNQHMTAGTGQFILMHIDGLTIKSSTANSTKKFRITVDDSGTLTATEVS